MMTSLDPLAIVTPPRLVAQGSKPWTSTLGLVVPRTQTGSTQSSRVFLTD